MLLKMDGVLNQQKQDGQQVVPHALHAALFCDVWQHAYREGDVDLVLVVILLADQYL